MSNGTRDSFAPCSSLTGSDQVRRVLIADADRTEQQHLRSVITRGGYAVTAVASVSHARRALTESFYSIIVMDRTLEDGDGLSLCADVRIPTMAERVFIVVLSAKTSRLEVAEGLRAGADVYLKKRTCSDAELMSYLSAATRIAEFAASSRSA